jgi:hypothetical protein
MRWSNAGRGYARWSGARRAHRGAGGFVEGRIGARGTSGNGANCSCGVVGSGGLTLSGLRLSFLFFGGLDAWLEM